MRRPIEKSRAADWIEGACMATPLLPPGVALGAASSDLHPRPESTPPLPPGIPSPVRE